MSQEMKQERLEKMIRDELDENQADRQTPNHGLISSVTPGAPGNNRGNGTSQSSTNRSTPTK